ncbi:uncharacterized protein METZ01_LOCUS363022, partial [marine metagenome]
TDHPTWNHQTLPIITKSKMSKRLNKKVNDVVLI